MNDPLPSAAGYADAVANELRADLQPFFDFGIKVNVAAFWIGSADLHVLAHLDHLPVINKTLSVRGRSSGQTSQKLLADELPKLIMLFEMIDADPHALTQKANICARPNLRLVD